MTRLTLSCLAALLALLLLAGGCHRDRESGAEAVAAPAPDVHAAAAGDPEHDVVGEAAATPEPAHDALLETAAPAVRWAADEPLIRGMLRVRVATAALEQAGREGSDPARVKEIAAELKSAVDGMFADCRLAPDADAALHPLLATVLGASQVLSAGVIDADALSDLQGVLGRYDELFFVAPVAPVSE